MEVVKKYPMNDSKNFLDISYPELDISNVNWFSVGKYGNDQTERHKRNLKLFGTSVQTSQECLKKFVNNILPKTVVTTILA